MLAVCIAFERTGRPADRMHVYGVLLRPYSARSSCTILADGLINAI